MSSVNQAEVRQRWAARGFSCDLWVDPPEHVTLNSTEHEHEPRTRVPNRIMAIRLGTFFKTSAELWMNLQITASRVRFDVSRILETSKYALETAEF
jgi:hypothetical protein